MVSYRQEFELAIGAGTPANRLSAGCIRAIRNALSFDVHLRQAIECEVGALIQAQGTEAFPRMYEKAVNAIIDLITPPRA